MKAGEAESVELIVSKADAGSRLDTYIAGSVASLSRSRAKALIEEGLVSIGGATIVEAKRPVKSGERLTITLPPAAPAIPGPESIPLSIVYEDEDLIVIDKPAGLVVHPAAGNQTGTLVNALIAHCGDSLSGIGGVARPGIVHRLDKDTTGLIVSAKSDLAHRGLSEQFADHGRQGPLELGYQALVWGAPAVGEGTVDAPIDRSKTNREKMQVVKTGGRRAVTHYRVDRKYGPKGKDALASMIECRLETGRTHQIRVHLAAIGHPLIGDRTYGAGFLTKAATLPEPARGLASDFPRQALHAFLLGFEHPVTHEEMHFESPLPKDMKTLADSLRALST
jgi:23S rRNA pseudouridine1911/1915/1917 synthase